MARGDSPTHDLDVLHEHKGERSEDVMERFPAAGGWLDDEICDSFPASDPLSHWSGPCRREFQAERAHDDRVHGAPIEEAPEHLHPEDPKPAR